MKIPTFMYQKKKKSWRTFIHYEYVHADRKLISPNNQLRWNKTNQLKANFANFRKYGLPVLEGIEQGQLRQLIAMHINYFAIT